MEQRDNEIQESWEAYGENTTVESSGLRDGIGIMFEYGLCKKDGTL